MKKSFLIIGLILVSLSLSACSISTSSSTSERGSDTSVFLSVNSGETWREAVALASPGQPSNIGGLNVNTMTFDPQDSLAVYLASFDRGLYYTYNIVNEGWVKAKGLPEATVSDVKVDPKNKCIIYAAITNKLYRSEDCSRTWKQVYYDNDLSETVHAVVVDHYNSKNIYIGTSRGEIIKSIDGGNSWRTIKRLEGDSVTKLIISPLESRLIFVATGKNNIYSFTANSTIESTDPLEIERNFAIQDWNDLNTVLKDFNLGTSFKDFVVGSSDGKMFIATNQSILRSPDNGITWEQIKLIQPDKEAVVNSMAVDPKDSNKLYYVTNTTFFSSIDGGVTWTMKKLPTSRAGREIIVDFNKPNNIYLGTIKLK